MWRISQIYAHLLVVLSTLFSSTSSETLASPIYEYLKDLCPIGQLPLTTSKTVKTCANLCPLGAMCFRGICCVPQPQCRHPAYRVSTGFPCLTSVKNNCPEGSQCVSSSQDGMHVCCSTRNSEKSFPISRLKPSSSSSSLSVLGGLSITKKGQSKSSVPVENSSQICPTSHPIIAHDGKSLVLCKDCVQGVCAKFRTSNVEVCCQNSDDICGLGSQVLMDSLVPRDCSKKPCGKGYECSLTPNGLRVCCSLARCPGGSLARSVCAAGCMRNEECVTIQDEQWCCPKPLETSFTSFICNNDGKGTGEKCDPAFPICSQNAVCEMNKDQSAHICCRKYKAKLANRKTLIITPPFYQSTTTQAPIIMMTSTEDSVEMVPKCQDPQARPLIENGLPYICPHPGDACIRPGFTCQPSSIDDVFVCCTARPPQIPMLLSLSTTTTSSPVTPSEEVEEMVHVRPSCPFSYMPSKNEKGTEQRCLTLFSLDCPFGYTCLPSSTTDSYLCCIRKPVIF